jgi:hypothetical protein
MIKMALPAQALLALAASVAFTAPAHAVFALSSQQTLNFATTVNGTYSYTGQGSTQFTSTAQVLTFDQFDTLAGRRTLQSVNISWAPTQSTTYTINNGSGNACNLSLSFNTSSTLSAGSLFNLTQEFLNPAISITLAQQSQASVGNVVISNSGSLTSFSAANINPFIGTSTISVSNALTSLTSQLTAVSGGTGNLSGSSAGDIGGQLIIQYNFLDPIPEPATWAMLIAGFGLVGTSMRRRRAVIAA